MTARLAGPDGSVRRDSPHALTVSFTHARENGRSIGVRTMDRRSKEPVFGLARLTSRFARNTGGAVAIWFAVLALPMAVLAFGLIDVNRAGVEKRHLQDALDAATLLAARSTATKDADLQVIGEAALKAQLTGSSDATLKSSSFKLVGTKIESSATADVTPVIANLWLGHDMTVGATAEVMRSSTNLELALVLDLTQSMSGTKIADLKKAAQDLLDLVISDVQSPYYSKAAIVPYSYGVNLGSTYAASGRGAVVGTKSLTATSWQSGTTSNAITAITKANPAKVTTQNNHGYSNGDVVYISGVSGMTQINGKAFIVANKANKTFELKDPATNANFSTSSGYSTYTSGGTSKKCLAAKCELVITATGHGYTAGDLLLIKNMSGASISDDYYTIGSVPTVDSYTISGTLGPSYTPKTTTGTSYCTKYGCEYYRFTNADGGTNTYQINTCATERPKADWTLDYTDTAPGTLPVGKQYTNGAATCLSSTITPLSSARETLKTTIGNYTVSGSTAGQIGIGWGWYAVSPEFAPMWPAGSKPAAYGTKDLLKVVVLMTDGAFNTPYCKGVQASNAEIGGGSSHINCAGTDGIAQAKLMCEAMKKKGVIVYTVGFALGTDADAIDLMNKCATDANHVYLPSGGAALKDAFAAIGRDITKLRLSK